MKNLRKRTNLELVSNSVILEKLINQPIFRDRVVYNKSCAVLMKKRSICFNKPIYVGFVVLELSKTLMYKFHYDVILPKCGDNISLLYTDTDSLFYEIKTEDFYSDMLSNELLDYFHTSYYPKDHFCYSVKNKNILSKFKDEYNGIPVVEFVGLRSKLYTFRIKKKEENIVKKEYIVEKAKEIKKNLIKNDISFDDFKNCLFVTDEETGDIHKLMRLFRSKKHRIKTILSYKLSLSNKYDKCIISENKIDTLPHGHYKLQYENSNPE